MPSNSTSASTSSSPSSSVSSNGASSSTNSPAAAAAGKNRTQKITNKKKTKNARKPDPNNFSTSSSCSSSFNPYLACCNYPPPPPPMVYRPDKGCYERVNGPFKKPIPTPYQRQIDKFREKCCPPAPMFIKQKTNYCCDDVKQLNVCEAELQRLRQERWKEEERKNVLEEKRCYEWKQKQYKAQVEDWEKVQAKCQRDRERRKNLLKQLMSHRVEMKKIKEEARQWRRYQQNLIIKQHQAKEEMWAHEQCQAEDERMWNQARLRMLQEDKLRDAQMKSRDSTEMAVPELEELRRMFVPVEQGPKETFEYFIVEPPKTDEEIRKEAEQKMLSLMGLRNEHGMHLNLSDMNRKKTTIQLAMGPKSSCKVINTPGAFCSNLESADEPNVAIPQCLKPLMQTLSYRVNEIDTPCLTMKAFGCRKDGEASNGKEVRLESGPNFNGARLYGTIVLPKGQALAPFYTQPYAVTF